MYEIFKSSEKITNPEPKPLKRNYPWKLLECGQSFTIPKEQIKAKSLRPLCSNMGRMMHKKFKMIEHENVFEVGRVK